MRSSGVEEETQEELMSLQLYDLNPMASVLEVFRWNVLGRSHASGPQLWASAAVVNAMLRPVLNYFWQTERTFADVV